MLGIYMYVFRVISTINNHDSHRALTDMFLQKRFFWCSASYKLKF